MFYKSYKVRIEPNKVQENFFVRSAGAARHQLTMLA
ncbi:MAG: helix-turn-helix domain-containing protein [Richelia sp. RM2_1_2]|nr:helix-turn-helix domain-containing protein [Richelia sp. RM2_1_2]